MLKKKKTTASGKLVLVKSVRTVGYVGLVNRNLRWKRGIKQGILRVYFRTAI